MNGTTQGPNEGKEREKDTTTYQGTEGKDKKDNDSKKEKQKREKTERRKKKSRDIDIPDNGVPFDRDWAWMIVLAGFVNFVLAAGYNRGTFIFFVYFLEQFGAPVTETALLFGVKASINSVVGLFIMNAVVGRFGVRKTVLVGGLCLSFSAILGSLATDVTSLILTQAVFHGLGMSMLNMPTTVLIGFYFRRRRSLANSLTKCGVGVGAVAFPPIVTFILDQYGLRGALLLMGGVCLNAVVAASLLRPTSFYEKRKQLRSEDECTEKLLSEEKSADAVDSDDDQLTKRKPCDSNGVGHEKSNGADHNPSASDHLNIAGHELCACNNSNSESHNLCVHGDSNCTGRNLCNGDQFTKGENQSCVVVIEQEKCVLSSPRQKNRNISALSPFSYQATSLSKSAPELNNNASHGFRRRSGTFSEKETAYMSSSGRSGKVLDDLNQWSVTRYLSTPNLEYDLPCVGTPPDLTPHHSQGNDTPTQRTCLNKTWQIVKKIFGILDFSLFHSPLFRLLVVFFITSPMINAVTTYLPAMCKERGLDENQRAVLLSTIGGLDFCCRLACGFIADLKIIKVSTMIGIAFVILGVVCQLTRLLTTFPLLVGLAVMQGALGGVANCMMPILIMEDIGLDNTAKAMGFNKLFSGAAMAAFHPLLGYIRDTTGSYDVAYNVIGGTTLVSAVVILCIRFVPHNTASSDIQNDASESEVSHDVSENHNQPKNTSCRA